MGFALGPKPIFPVLGPRDRAYFTINLKPKPGPFMAFLELCTHFHASYALQHL
jgi:hypothetical protein